MPTRTFFARAPLTPSFLAPLPAGAISARGDLHTHLVSLRAGLLSRCASVFPETGEQSVFFGGTLPAVTACADLLEASLLTASLLGDEELRREALRLCTLCVKTQREDGSFGTEGDSFKARGRMLRALQTAYTMTGDNELLRFMLRYMKYLRDTLQDTPLSQQDAMHTADTLEAGVFLYNVTGQKAILPVLTLLIQQGFDYTSLMHSFPFRTPVLRPGSALEAADSEYHQYLLRAGSAANLSEGLRTSALCGLITGSGKHLSAPETGLARMNRLHGSACGAIAGDPLLAGTNPARGVSAVSACELAASLETLLSCPLEERMSDQLEEILYNAVPAAFCADGRGVQSIQQTNQAKLSAAARFPLASDTSGLFSLEDADALCALLAAWPRFAQHQWMLSRDEGLAAVSYAPCTVRYRLGGASVRVTVESSYPVSGSIRMKLALSQSAAFPLHLRIPAWAQGAAAAIGGEIIPAQAGAYLTLNREWHDGDEILLTLPMTCRTVERYHRAVSVHRGPLCFVYAPETSEKDGVISARKPFGIALKTSEPMRAEVNDDGATIQAAAVRVSDWGMSGESAAQPPMDLNEQGKAFTAQLVPYAKAAIRLAVMPTV